MNLRMNHNTNELIKIKEAYVFNALIIRPFSLVNESNFINLITTFIANEYCENLLIKYVTKIMPTGEYFFSFFLILLKIRFIYFLKYFTCFRI